MTVQRPNNGLPNIQNPLAQLHRQDWQFHNAEVFANIVNLLKTSRPPADILLLQQWGCPAGNSVSALGPRAPEHRHLRHIQAMCRKQALP